jgi:hypothetical protein
VTELNKLAELKDAKTGEVICQVFGPPNALTSGDALSQGLYALSELIIRGLQPDERGGGLGGEFGYGANFENDVFMMHRYCWCESEDCAWCEGEAPNFRHKASGFEASWYKYVGRGMETNRKLTVREWADILRACFDSIPAEAHERAAAQVAHEQTPEYQAEQERAYRLMREAVARALEEQADA